MERIGRLRVVFAAARKSRFSKYSELQGIEFPGEYKLILSSANGINAFGLKLYGIHTSMVKSPPLLDRSKAQVLFLVRKRSFILVAGPSFTRRTPVIFEIVEEKSFPFLKSGKVVGRWSDFRTFLTDELQGAEDYHQFRWPK